jgi:hypothetical protein
LYSQKQYSSRISNICYVSGGEDRWENEEF